MGRHGQNIYLSADTDQSQNAPAVHQSPYVRQGALEAQLMAVNQFSS